MGFCLKYFLMLISHFDTNFSFKCFFPLKSLFVFFFFSLTLLRLLVTNLKISLGKWLTALENT